MAGTNGKKRVTFSLTAPEASEVYLCGTFNGWDVTKHPMKKDAKGNWKAMVMLVPGTYEYKLRVDGEWVNDPTAEQLVPNEFGTTNCVREVALSA